MLDQARKRLAEFQQRLRDENIDIALICDESSIAYLAGFWGYLSVEFGRPTFLVVHAHEAPRVITPLMESEMVSGMTWVESVLTWEDTGPRHHYSWHAQGSRLSERPRLGGLHLSHDSQSADHAIRPRHFNGTPTCECKNARTWRPCLLLLLQHGAVQTIQARL